VATRPKTLRQGARVSLAACAALAIVTLALVSAQTPAPRIVSLVPAVTEMLFAIDAGPQVVGVGSFDNFPDAVGSLPRVGALLDPDVERILQLRPDLVVTYGSQSDLLQQLQRAGVRAFEYRHSGIPGIFQTLAELGSAVDRRDQADRVTRDLQQHLDQIRARVAGRPRPRTLLVFERDPTSLRGLYASGGVGFLHEMLEIAGGVNVFADVQREAVQPSTETLLARAPEVIVELRAAGLALATESVGGEQAAWSGLSAIPAVRLRRIHVLSGDHLVVAGPRIGRATETLARALHPEAFP